MKRYIGMIWIQDKPGKRVSALANSLKEPRAKLEAEYGKGNVFDLHNREDAAQQR